LKALTRTKTSHSNAAAANILRRHWGADQMNDNPGNAVFLASIVLHCVADRVDLKDPSYRCDATESGSFHLQLLLPDRP
jgi:hypothetical protein